MLPFFQWFSELSLKPALQSVSPDVQTTVAHGLLWEMNEQGQHVQRQNLGSDFQLNQDKAPPKEPTLGRALSTEHKSDDGSAEA